MLGLIVQTVGAGLLALIFLYLSRGKSQGVLQAAGFALALPLPVGAGADVFWRAASRLGEGGLSSTSSSSTSWPSAWPRSAWAGRSSLGKPLAVTAVAALPVAFLIGRLGRNEARFYAIHMGILAVGWLLVAVFIFQSPRAGLGRQFSGLLALLTSAAQFCYVALSPPSRRAACSGPPLHRVRRRPVRDAVRDRADHLGHGGHRAAARGAPLPDRRRHPPLAAEGLARSPDRHPQPVLPRRDQAASSSRARPAARSC